MLKQYQQGKEFEINLENQNPQKEIWGLMIFSFIPSSNYSHEFKKLNRKSESTKNNKKSKKEKNEINKISDYIIL